MACTVYTHTWARYSTPRRARRRTGTAKAQQQQRSDGKAWSNKIMSQFNTLIGRRGLRLWRINQGAPQYLRKHGNSCLGFYFPIECTNCCDATRGAWPSLSWLHRTDTRAGTRERQTCRCGPAISPSKTPVNTCQEPCMQQNASASPKQNKTHLNFITTSVEHRPKRAVSRLSDRVSYKWDLMRHGYQSNDK